MWKRILATLFSFMLLAAACGDDDATTADPAADDGTTDDDMTDDDMTDDDMTDDDMTDDDMTDDDMADDAPLSPAAIAVADQTGDGTTVVIASITLPAHGFIAIHDGSGGSPGPVIGHSDQLPSGESTDVVVTLDTPLTGDQSVFPMAHVDVNGNGIYEFGGEENIDLPATNADGDVAVAGLEYTIG